MRSGQGKTRCAVVILRRHPRRGSMTDGAVRGKTRRDMIGIGCAVILHNMATAAICHSAGKIPPRMALETIERGVGPGERKPGQLGVVKILCPPVHAVTGFAFRRISQGLVIDRLRAVVVLDMAEGTIGIQSPVQPNGCALVAVLAFQHPVRTEQRKSVCMPVNGTHDFTPSADAVALLAVTAHLPAMNVRMTASALGRDVGENQFDVTLPAIQALVHAAQRKTRAAVVEVRKSPDRLIACAVMAVFACRL